MSIPYPVQRFGRFGLGMGLTPELVHRRFGFDLGERYHLDVAHRIRTTMEIDRAVFDAFGPIGLGFREPFPRVSLAPYGHRFVAVMYGCACSYDCGADPAVRPRGLSEEEILALEPWTPERFQQSEPVAMVRSQAEYLARHGGGLAAADDEFNLHDRLASSLPNLGSVINNGLSIQGEQLLSDCAANPPLVARLYENVAEVMLRCLEYFPRLDGRTPADLFVGNCAVAMISPATYRALDEPFDRRLMDHARRMGARFTIHQDSHVNVHLENYARFEYLHGVDFGQDTDFEKVARLMPGVTANCILFPSWLRSHSLDEIREELLRLMAIGRSFPRFTFVLLEVDSQLAEGRLFEFHELFRRCAAEQTGGSVDRRRAY